MAVTKNQIKAWFQTALKPTQAQFAAWIDAMRHVDDKIAQTDLTTILSDKIDSLPTTDTLNAAIANKVNRWEQWQGAFIVKDATSGELMLNVDPTNSLVQLGDFQGNNNATFISVDNANSEIVVNAADGFRGAGSFWRLNNNGAAFFQNVTVNTLSSTVLKVDATGKLVAAVAGTDYQTPIGYAPVNKAGDTMLGHLTLFGDAVNAMHPITKSQFDNLQTGLSWKYSAKASTVAALPSYTSSANFLTLTATANGALALDGVTLNVGDRILVKNEAGVARINNGGYTVTQVGSVSQPYILTRTSNVDSSAELEAATFYVREGTLEKNRVYAVNSNPVTLGTTEITFALIAGAGTYANGTGLDLTGNVFSIANLGVSNAMLAGGIADAKISSAANWNTAFNARINNLTNTGNNGAATFVGNVLNVPNYTLAGLGGLPLIGGNVTGNLGLSSAVPTHALTIGSSRATAAFRIFNTVDQVTNTEFLESNYNNGVASWIISSNKTGTGAIRPLSIQLSGRSSITMNNTLSNAGYIIHDALLNNSGSAHAFTTNTLTNAFQAANVVAIHATIAGSGNTNTNMLWISPFITPTGSELHYLINAGTNTAAVSNGVHTRRFSVDHIGNAFVLGNLSIGNTINAVSPTSPNRTITMVIGGTTYYIPCKTTND